jgi:hypothetical protein
MTPAPLSKATSWAESAVEETCRRAEEWYRALPLFEPRVNLGSVTGFKYPALLSEQDCVMHFARFLNEGGVPWEAIHHEVSVSRWMFDQPHPAATASNPAESRWRVDLALLKSEDFLAASLPAIGPGFQFDAFFEFAYLDDFWTLPGVNPFGEPGKRREKVEKDVAKIGRYLAGGACQIGYVIVFEECDWGFSPTFVSDAEATNGCRVRFVRGYSTSS